MTSHRFTLSLATRALLVALLFAGVARAGEPSRLRADGSRIINADGEPVALRGVNLGNWLLLETWMTAWPQPDQHAVFATLDRRFGEGERRRLMTIWRDGYVAERDFELIRGMGFNVVRLPIDVRLLDDEQSSDGGFTRIDQALDLAEASGLYVILDLHAAPGGQSDEHHTGEAGRDFLWDSAEDQAATVEVWDRLSERYKGRDVVAAYDLLNEPWSDGQRDVRATLEDISLRCLDAIRANGDDHVVLFPGTQSEGAAVYGDLRGRIGDVRMENVGFTHHYYAGLFGSATAVSSHVRTLGLTFPAVQRYLDHQRAPMLVGEFNVVLDRAGGDRMMRTYFDDFGRRGWMATAWSYKLLQPEGGVASDNWYFVTNAEPLEIVDLETASLAEIESFFKDLATMPLAVDDALVSAIHDDDGSAFPVRSPALPTTTPSGPTPKGWQTIRINGAPAGATASPAGIELIAGGADIGGTSDSGGLLARTVPTDGAVEATVEALLESDVYAKAGLMLRGGDDAADAAAPFAMINVFPNGTVAFMTRDAIGATTSEVKSHPGPLPTRLRLERRGDDVVGLIQTRGGWAEIGRSSPRLGARAVGGPVVTSHALGALTRALFQDVEVQAGDAKPTPAARLDPQAGEGENLLQNASFETAGDSPDTASGWNRWGQWINRETKWQPTHSGTGMIGYHHWERDSADDSGLWQDVTVTAGDRYRFGIFAHADQPDAGSHAAARISLALEATVDGQQIVLDEVSANVADLEKTGGWSLLTVDATAPSEGLRVLVRVVPADNAPRGGALKLDDAFLKRVDIAPQ